MGNFWPRGFIWGFFDQGLLKRVFDHEGLFGAFFAKGVDLRGF